MSKLAGLLMYGVGGYLLIIPYGSILLGLVSILIGHIFFNITKVK